MNEKLKVQSIDEDLKPLLKAELKGNKGKSRYNLRIY